MKQGKSGEQYQIDVLRKLSKRIFNFLCVLELVIHLQCASPVSNESGHLL